VAELRLDRFWAERLPTSRKGTRWDDVLQVLATYRLISPGSEWRLHRQWFLDSAMADLLESDFGLAEAHKLYACHDPLIAHKQALFSHLTQRWRDLFNASFDVLLYDLTSTYFEVDAADLPEGSKRRHGYSRDKRPDCPQVVIALVVTPEGLPLAYEVLPGNTADSKTLRAFLAKIESQYGKARRVWVTDRGMPPRRFWPRCAPAIRRSAIWWERRRATAAAPRRRCGVSVSQTVWEGGRPMTRSKPAPDYAKRLVAENPATRTFLSTYNRHLLCDIEEAFRNLKGDLAIRPIHHQDGERIEAHIFIAFLAYCLHVTIGLRLKGLAPGLTPRSLFEKFAAVQMINVHIPTTHGRELRLTRNTQPESELMLLLERLRLDLPAQPPPKITAIEAAKAQPL